MPLYTTVDRMFVSLPELGSATSVLSAHLATFIDDAEAEINANIARLYALPLTTTPPLLVTLATDIAIYRVLTRRLFTAERLAASPWPDRYKESLAILLRIASGELPLEVSGTVLTGRTDIAEVYSTTKNYVPTFWEGGWPEQDVDADKLEEEGDRRGLTPFRDRLL